MESVCLRHVSVYTVDQEVSEFTWTSFVKCLYYTDFYLFIKAAGEFHVKAPKLRKVVQTVKASSLSGCRRVNSD